MAYSIFTSKADVKCNKRHNWRTCALCM